MKEGRGSLKGTPLTEGKETHTAANGTYHPSSVTSEESTYKGCRAEGERREREGDHDQRGLESHRNNCEDKEKAILSRGQNYPDPSDYDRGKEGARITTGGKSLQTTTYMRKCRRKVLQS